MSKTKITKLEKENQQLKAQLERKDAHIERHLEKIASMRDEAIKADKIHKGLKAAAEKAMLHAETIFQRLESNIAANDYNRSENYQRWIGRAEGAIQMIAQTLYDGLEFKNRSISFQDRLEGLMDAAELADEE